MGFQNGAIVYAQKYGIQLMEIRHPIDKDWEGRIKNIHLDLCLRTIGEIRPQIFVNKTRVAELGIAPPENKEFNKLTDQVRIDFNKMVVDKKTVDEKNSKTVYELIQKLPVGNPGRGNKFVFAFQNATIHLENMDLPLDGIEFTYDTHESTEHITIYGEDSIMAIVKNITDGWENTIDQFGRVHIRESI